MPEGDTLFKLAAALRPQLTGVRIDRATAKRVDASAIDGTCVTDVRAAGKHLLIALREGWTLRAHLGLYGSWHRYRHGEYWRKPGRQATLVLYTDDSVHVLFNGKEVEILRSGGIRQRTLRSRLGQDLAVQPVDPDNLLIRIRELCLHHTPACDMLLDQRIACGIGNVYKSEALFLAGIHPERAVTNIDPAALVALYVTAGELIQKNLTGGPRVTRFVNDGRGRSWVYGRRGAPCFQCGQSITRALTGKTWRSSYWCSTCQPEFPCAGDSAHQGQQ